MLHREARGYEEVGLASFLNSFECTQLHTQCPTSHHVVADFIRTDGCAGRLQVLHFPLLLPLCLLALLKLTLLQTASSKQLAPPISTKIPKKMKLPLGFRSTLDGSRDPKQPSLGPGMPVFGLPCAPHAPTARNRPGPDRPY